MLQKPQPLGEISPNIHYSTSSGPSSARVPSDNLKMANFDIYKIAIPVPRQRLPQLSSWNPQLGKRAPSHQIFDAAVSK